ncbi:MAG: vitamin B12-dependent ribonucleotide reductase [Oscillospiraceae bacterium]|jgi:ribonucleoside-diphosphate reductase alpha chain|nr:vitamin B12-dependent ribonucleotide reductase [Oscillospiraceae bacterium]
MQWTDNARRVLEKRYLAKDEQGRITETIEELFRRVAEVVARGDLEYDANADTRPVAEMFYNMMTARFFMPNSPTLMNAGRPLGQLSACFVLPVPDSLTGIFDAVKNAALIHQSGGGTGFSFSRLRPGGSSVRTSGGVASGPISFMKVFNAATEAIKQGGVRRGANMGILRVDHPDIIEFISCKKDTREITNFNISVGLTEEFMRAAREGSAYALINPVNNEKTGELNAKEVFDLIVQSAWETGEPGIIFLDRVNRDNVVPELSEIEATNPCGEQPLLPYESCNLGSINLAEMISRIEAPTVDWTRLDQIVEHAVHFLDNVITINRYPIPEIKERTLGTRKIGLGVMGWADMLFQLGIPYDSQDALDLAEQVMSRIQEKAWAASRKLAAVRGAFPYLSQSIYKNDPNPPRNGTLTTIAPTGTISILCNASSGIEPLFALAFARNVMDNDKLVEAHPDFERVAKERGFYTPELMLSVARKGTLSDVEGVPEDVRRVYVTAHDISPEAHIRMQAAFQRNIDNAVSKTVNFSNSATKDDVRRTYELAWELGCKGVTIYRDGSRSEQVLTAGHGTQPRIVRDGVAEPRAIGESAETAAARSEISAAPEVQEPPRYVQPRSRKDVTTGITEKVKIGCGNLYITVNYDDQGLCEVFTNLGRAGGCPSQSEATSRLVSMALRAGVDPEVMVEQLRGIRCHSTLRQPGLKVLSCPDAIGRVLEKVLRDRRGVKPEEAGTAAKPESAAEHCIENCSLCGHPNNCVNKRNGASCPECGAIMEREGGCAICRSCGYSKCN